MPVKPKNTQRDLHTAEAAHLARPEPVVTRSRADAPRSVSVDAMEKEIAKEDAKIIAKASARAIRRGLH